MKYARHKGRIVCYCENCFEPIRKWVRDCPHCGHLITHLEMPQPAPLVKGGQSRDDAQGLSTVTVIALLTVCSLVGMVVGVLLVLLRVL